MKKKYRITNILLEGDYYSGYNNEGLHYVKIGAPEQDSQSENNDYYCALAVETPKGSGNVITETAFGVNALQALEQAYVAVRKIIC
jgi:hypothetical protein